MKHIIFIIFLTGFATSSFTYAWWVFPLNDLEFSDHSGYIKGSGDNQAPQHLRIVQFHDFSNYYAYVELRGIKPEEVDIQRQGAQITFRQVRGRMEENESKDAYSSFQSYSSFTRRLILPADADPDISKMNRDNHENFIRLTIPKRFY